MKSLKIALFIIFVCLAGCGLIGLADTPIRNADWNEIVNLGDSLFANSGDINNDLYDYADGTFRHYSRNGSQMTGGTMGKTISLQYAEAKSDHSIIDVVYLDGGANDILMPFVTGDKTTCTANPISQACKTLIDTKVLAAATALLNTMNNDGVDHVIWLGYYRIKNGLYGSTKLNPAVDYADNKMRDICNAHTIDCVFVDPRAAFAGHESTYIISDGIHPSSAGSQVLANLLWPEISKHL